MAAVSRERSVGSASPTMFAQAALVVAVGLGLGLVYTAPLVWHFREGLPYAYAVSPERRFQALVPGDQLQYYYFLSLTDDMVHGRVPWFQDAYQFSAPHASARWNFFFLPFSLLFAAAAPLGRITAYNLLLLLSFPATALSTFLLARRLGADALGSGVAAAALTLLPYRVASLAGGHPTGVAFFLLPLTVYFLEASWQNGRRAHATAAGLCLLCLAVNEPHFLYFLVFLLPLWLLFALWRLEPERSSKGFIVAGAWLAVATLGPTIAVALRSARRGGAVWSPADLLMLFVVLWSLLALTWRVTAEVRARAGEAGEHGWVREARSYVPLLLLGVYGVQVRLDVPHLGFALAAATVAALAVCKTGLIRAVAVLSRREDYRIAARRLLGLWPVAAGFLAAVVLLLEYKASFIDPAGQGSGRSLREIELFAPRPIDFFRRSSTVLTRELYPGMAVAALALAGLTVREGRAMVLVALVFGALALGPNAPQWLPLYPAAFHLVPFFSIIRQPAKLFAVTAVALALASAFGATAIGRRLGRRARAAVAGAALAAILIDFSSVLPFGISTPPAHNAAYSEVAKRAAGSNLLELPLWPGDSAFSSIYQYWATRTRVPTVNGYSPTAPRDYVARVYRPLESMNLGELGEDQNRLLDELRVRLVTLHRDAYPPQVGLYPYRFALATMRHDPNLSAVEAEDGVYLFERAQGPYRAWDETVPWPTGVMFEAESLTIGAGERVGEHDASGGMLVRGRSHGDRPVVFGPYRPMPRGRYEVRFRVRGRGRVEVSTDLGRSELAAAEVREAKWTEVPLELELERSRTVEFRFWSDAAAGPATEIDWVLVTKLDGRADSSGPQRFEAEDLTALYGSDQESPKASGGAYAVLEYPAGAVTRDGPYRAFGPGRIEIAVRSRGGPLELRVEPADGRRRFADLRVPPRADWGLSTVGLDLPGKEILCARLVSSGSRADVDYVEITDLSARAPQPRAGPREISDAGAWRRARRSAHAAGSRTGRPAR
jgi:hypothetical protein